jgi:hypothetical protein
MGYLRTSGQNNSRECCINRTHVGFSDITALEGSGNGNEEKIGRAESLRAIVLAKRSEP